MREYRYRYLNSASNILFNNELSFSICNRIMFNIHFLLGQILGIPFPILIVINSQIYNISANGFGLCVRAGFGAQSFNLLLKFIRGTKLQVCTSPRLTQTRVRCIPFFVCLLFYFFQCVKIFFLYSVIFFLVAKCLNFR